MASKVVIVTGASKGIGLEATKFLLQASHRVVAVARSEQQLQALKEQHGEKVACLAADLTNPDSASQAVKLAVDTFGRLDAIVINHGVVLPLKRIADTDIEDLKRIYDANLFSGRGLAKAAIPQLRQTKGRIIVTGSGAALHAYTGWSSYGGSKAAMNSFVQHLACEEKDIASICINPGRTDTGMQAEIRQHGKESMDAAAYQTFIDVFETGTLVKPEQPGRVLASLAVSGLLSLSGQFLRLASPQHRITTAP
jgi:NAD(P)-dependent dehydrogenase (short-subunit alcohol dehydrogenase family)